MDKALWLNSVIPKNVSQVYKFIRHFKSNSNFPDTIHYHSNPITNEFDKTEASNNFFASTFTTILPLG